MEPCHDAQRGGAEKENRVRGRKREEGTRYGRTAHRHENDATLPIAIGQQAARKLRNGVPHPHAGEGETERTVRHGKGVTDGGHDRTDHEPTGHGSEKSQGARPEDGALSGPKRHG